MPNYKEPTERASDMMWDAGLGGGSPYVHCSCGKDHSVPEDSDDSFGYIELAGMLFVYGCEGCVKSLLKYERFIWSNRNHIREGGSGATVASVMAISTAATVLGIGPGQQKRSKLS